MLDAERTINEGHMLAPLKSAALAQEDVPGRVLIAPWGEVESTQGTFVVDEESARLVVEAFAEHGTDLPIDYEHQTLGGTFAAPNGQAPAAGWIKHIESQPGVGLFALVHWTEPALEQLTARQYRYLSPVAIVRKTDRKLMALHSAALTNKPAIVGMQPIVNREMNEAALSQEMVSLRETLSLADEATDAEVLIAAVRRVRELDDRLRKMRTEERIDGALRSGKLSRGQVDWARKLIVCNEMLFDEWLTSAWPLVETGRLVKPPALSTGREPGHADRTKAAAEYRAHPDLHKLTSEEAYVGLALRGRV